MAILRCISTLQMTSGIPEDAVVNVFHVIDNTVPPNTSAILTAWQTFQRAVGFIYPGTVKQTGHSLKIYDLADPKPRAPIFEGSWSFDGTSTGETLPAEIALCVSFQGLRVSGESQARRRGRIYLGPFQLNQTEDGRPLASTVTTLAQEMDDFIDELDAAGVVFGVYSEADGVLVTARQVWVDNAWDVQRRRGLAPSSRVTREISL